MTYRTLQSGFSFIEVLLTVSVIIILTGLTLPFAQNILYRNNLDAGVRLYTSLLNEAHSYARATKNESAWGVYTGNESFILYSGMSYANRDTEWDKEVLFPRTLSVDSSYDVNFSAMDAEVVANNGVVLSDPRGDKIEVSVNLYGTISTQ